MEEKSKLPDLTHPWEKDIPGKFTPAYSVDKRIKSFCSGKPVPPEEVLEKAYWNNMGDKYEF